MPALEMKHQRRQNLRLFSNWVIIPNVLRATYERTTQMVSTMQSGAVICNRDVFYNRCMKGTLDSIKKKIQEQLPVIVKEKTPNNTTCIWMSILSSDITVLGREKRKKQRGRNAQSNTTLHAQPLPTTFETRSSILTSFPSVLQPLWPAESVLGS